jgi:hypothetical protein
MIGVVFHRDSVHIRDAVLRDVSVDAVDLGARDARSPESVEQLVEGVPRFLAGSPESQAAAVSGSGTTFSPEANRRGDIAGAHCIDEATIDDAPGEPRFDIGLIELPDRLGSPRIMDLIRYTATSPGNR